MMAAQSAPCGTLSPTTCAQKGPAEMPSEDLMLMKPHRDKNDIKTRPVHRPGLLFPVFLALDGLPLPGWPIPERGEDVALLETHPSCQTAHPERTPTSCQLRTLVPPPPCHRGQTPDNEDEPVPAPLRSSHWPCRPVRGGSAAPPLRRSPGATAGAGGRSCSPRGGLRPQAGWTGSQAGSADRTASPAHGTDCAGLRGGPRRMQTRLRLLFGFGPS